jgi:hypothetical protein
MKEEEGEGGGTGWKPGTELDSSYSINSSPTDGRRHRLPAGHTFVMMRGLYFTTFFQKILGVRTKQHTAAADGLAQLAAFAALKNQRFSLRRSSLSFVDIGMSEGSLVAEFSASIRDLARIKNEPDSAQSSFLSLTSEAAVKSKLIESSLDQEHVELRSLQSV